MINRRQARFDSSGHEHEPLIDKVSELCALRSLIQYELGYGGVITNLSSSEVEVRTKVLNKTDFTIFTGEPEEMKRLVRVAAFHSQMLAQLSPSASADVVRELLGDQAGNPFLFTNLAPLVIGNSAKLTFCVALAEVPEERLEQFARVGWDDLFAAFEMAEADGLSFIEVFNLLVEA